MNDDLDWKQITFNNAQSLSRLTILVEQTSRDVGRLAKHEAKIDRLITQNGEIKDAIGDIQDTISNDKKKLKWVYAVAEYPKITFVMLVFFYTLTFYEVRTAIGIHLKPIVDLIKLIKGVL